MATNNKKQCLQALETMGIKEYELIVGKNQNQVLWVLFNGNKYHSNITYTKQQFLDLFNDNITTSVATSKFNNTNHDEEFKELQAWLDQLATYAKKSCYMYNEKSLNEIILYTMQDFGVSEKRLQELHKNWNSDNGWNAKITSDLIYRNGIYTPVCCLQQTIKQWLTVHLMYEHDDAQIDYIINRLRG